MKKTLFILGIVTLCIATSPLLASDRKESKRAEQRRSESPEPSCHSCGLWRVCFSCCCKPKVVDIAIVSLDVIHTAIEVVLLGAPGAIREIYLLCQSAGYALSKAAVRSLNNHGFLDERGNLNPGWRDRILQLLAHDGTVPGPEAFYFEQSIEDLKARYPEVVYQLGVAAKAHNVYISAMMTTLLHDQYNLIDQPSKITLEELNTLARALKKDEAESKISKSHTVATTSRFILRSIPEAASGRLVNSVIIS